jgi:hypothetical protein
MAASFKDVDFQHVTPATRLLEKRRQVSAAASRRAALVVMSCV